MSRRGIIETPAGRQSPAQEVAVNTRGVALRYALGVVGLGIFVLGPPYVFWRVAGDGESPGTVAPFFALALAGLLAAAAIAWFLFLFIFVFTLIQNRMQDRWVYYETE